jgi:hypothetical protein
MTASRGKRVWSRIKTPLPSSINVGQRVDTGSAQLAVAVLVLPRSSASSLFYIMIFHRFSVCTTSAQHHIRLITDS